jgi:hypothetical protein
VALANAKDSFWWVEIVKKIEIWFTYTPSAPKYKTFKV